MTGKNKEVQQKFLNEAELKVLGKLTEEQNKLAQIQENVSSRTQDFVEMVEARLELPSGSIGNTHQITQDGLVEDVGSAPNGAAGLREVTS